ncbi:hypothetical protein A2291_01245 [candidate division WOR-1 bacterium RIFOXYB2_FULL_42_35]|uniref:MtN3 and saliva related transmembrane protein n=1 Tax=candidate division WOR-1 bacterium RIFOXYC2_FULL_41_25 TaxID=1802586 RepID=A0A1F4TMX6_UNCSA|nr:MAG: hypothetical protein A2247_04670 [candidate division WOR-1 bacterium RIFOXYA2_FULL_41_14]OGC22932.1 MAG: hypothetical protein A2291_01245 [candidate division WOR-1 bacterium RIFOXYB2_FULL_42_35]OGC33413.1 MAG: hypothetical protein A2462_06635 [candidate division WOR-1 bacterium RIFOXYC2_FULL_41_25]OGC43469.1 MAG: hypothetical protein A2548_06795 [candidate division WOR-1 bacterium RIFOXYD2_FULL_41_8]
MKIVGLIAATLTSSGFLPQIIRGFKTKKLEDVSTLMLLVIIIGTACWTLYGFFIGDLIVVMANTFTCATVVLLLIMKYSFRR